MTVHPFVSRISSAEFVERSGRITRIFPTYIEADGPALPLGALCAIAGAESAQDVALAEVVSVGEQSIRLAPLDVSIRAELGMKVIAMPNADRAPVGEAFLGRAVDGLARPIDGQGAIHPQAWRPLHGDPTLALKRISPRQPLETGVRAIDTLLPLDRGQRVGIFAAAGVGKTSLVHQLIQQVKADRVVIALCGERGREVEALWNDRLDGQTRAKSILVAATSDQTAALRARACLLAATLAEHWRAEGHNVLLVLDSVTRLAMALREIGLAAGEPPTVRAYTPSVFAVVPRLIERFGAIRDGGSITAVLTVLCETDDLDDPLSEMMRSILDGHIVLSRALAEQGHFPAIDVPKSVSRLGPSLMSPEHARLARSAGSALATYEEARTLIESGIYSAGASAEIDRALKLRPALTDFLRQDQNERVGREQSLRGLSTALGEAAHAL